MDNTKKEVKKTVKKAATKKAVVKVVAKKDEVKKVVSKPAVKPATVKSEKVKMEKVEAIAPIVKKKEGTLKIDVYDTAGKVAESITLSAELFGGKINKQLIAQAVRVYLANQRMGTASTKTRGEVDGSTRKIYRQEGTGRARHGAIRAPLFVKGGIAHGPKPKDYSLGFPQNMRRAALISSLTSKLKDNEIKIIKGLGKIEPKTKIAASILSKLSIAPSEKTLIVMPDAVQNVTRAARNIEGVTLRPATLLNTYEVLVHKNIVVMLEAIEVLEKALLKPKKS